MLVAVAIRLRAFLLPRRKIIPRRKMRFILSWPPAASVCRSPRIKRCSGITARRGGGDALLRTGNVRLLYYRGPRRDPRTPGQRADGGRESRQRPDHALLFAGEIPGSGFGSVRRLTTRRSPPLPRRSPASAAPASRPGRCPTAGRRRPMANRCWRTWPFATVGLPH